MQKIKKFLRLLLFICLIILACLGVGLSGGVPLPLSNKRRDSGKENIELIEPKIERSDVKQNQVKE